MKQKKAKSIGDRMKGAQTFEFQERILTVWRQGWYDDQKTTINMVRDALRNGDIGKAYQLLDQLDGLTDKRFTGLSGVIKRVCDPNRVLMTEDERSKLIAANDVMDETITNESSEEVLENLEKEPITIITEVVDEPKEPEIVQDVIDEPVKEPIVKETNSTNDEAEELMNEIVKSYNAGIGVKSISALSGLSAKKVTKILVTKNVFSSEVYDEIKDLKEQGYTYEQIAKLLGYTKKSMDCFIPYSKGIYGLKEVSKNALRIREYRLRKTNNYSV